MRAGAMDASDMGASASPPGVASLLFSLASTLYFSRSHLSDITYLTLVFFKGGEHFVANFGDP